MVNVIEPRLLRIRAALTLAAVGMFAMLYAPQPLLPQLAQEFSLSPGVAALTVSTTTGGLAVAAIPLGVLSEALGRRSTMIASMLTAATLGLLMPLMPHFQALIAARLLQGVAIAGLAAVAAAYLADATNSADLGTSIAIYVAGTTIGGMSGRLIGGVVGDQYTWQGGMLAVALLASLCTALFILLLPTELDNHRREPGWRHQFAGISTVLRDPVIYAPYGVAFWGMASFVAVYNALAFRLISAPLHIPPAYASLSYLAYAAATVTSPIAGHLADRIGRIPILLGCLAITLLGLLVMLANGLSLILAGLVLFTGGFFAAHAVAAGWVGARAPRPVRGHASSLYQLAYYGGSSVGGLLSGLVFDTWGWSGMTLLLICWLTFATAGLRLAHGQAASLKPYS